MTSTNQRNTNRGGRGAPPQQDQQQAQCEPSDAVVAVADEPLTAARQQGDGREADRSTRFEVDLLADWCKP